ncbi:MAG: aldehyde dehydrogenase [Ignavibacteriales bacterium]|nr:aldehyde dehydrogenase [Ignavibacteriales bacterium]
MKEHIKKYDLILDGKRLPSTSGKEATIQNPANGKVIATVAEGGPEDIKLAVEAADRTFRQGPWRRFSSRERSRLLFRISMMIRDHAEELARLETQNVGKPIREARDEVQLAADCFQFYAGAIDKTGGQNAPVAAPGVGLTFREPIGVCGLIIPWNFPITISCWKIAPALAMGNTVVVKPASQTPLTALRVAELALEAGIPPGVLNVVTGPGNLLGEAFVRHPLVRKISFTGSTEVGRNVMKAASDDIKRVTLELGGKSANIVFADAEIDKAVHSAVWSALGNAGQDCCARSRLLLQRSIRDEFLTKLTDQFKKVRVGDPLEENTELGSLISKTHRDRVRSYVEVGVSEGARLLCGGDIPTDAALSSGSYLSPAIFSEVTPAMRIAQEEIFGPVVSVLTFETEEDAVALANNSLYGLSGSLWTRDIGRALRVAKSVETGVLSVNSGQSVHLEMPFGGVKLSGVGRELGLAVLDHYSEWKSVFINTQE